MSSEGLVKKGGVDLMREQRGQVVGRIHCCSCCCGKRDRRLSYQEGQGVGGRGEGGRGEGGRAGNGRKRPTSLYVESKEESHR